MLVKRKKIAYLFCHRKINICNSKGIQLNILQFKKHTILVIRTKDNFIKNKYLLLPNFFKVNLYLNTIYFLFLNKKRFHNFYHLFLYFITNTKIFFKQLVLKGGGFRVSFFSKLNRLEFKLGFTHKKYVLMPLLSYTHLIFQKPVLIVLDYNSARLGNFIKKIRNTKEPNAYTGCGWWGLKEQQKLKIIKKQ